MDITTFTATPPAPGSTAPGDLYIDLQSRTLWLGVDPAVDANEAVLISDMIGLLENDAQVLLDARAYTDPQIPTRAPVVHTHTSTQITDFTAAVTNVANNIPGANWVRGMIMMYSGSLAEIGVGNLAGWSLCDGGNGTPDLRDRFVIGAGNKPVGNKNTPANFNTLDAGSHYHIADGTALTIDQLPPHSHYANGLGGSAYTGYETASHSHSQYTPTGYTVEGGSGAVGLASATGGFGTQTGTQSANHQHYVTIYVYGSVNNTGSGYSHTHVIQSAGVHAHEVSAAAMREAIPYYALAFIMKL